MATKVEIPKFTLLIPTKNRLPELIITLRKIKFLLANDDLKCIICDDGSTDNTFEYIKQNYPKIEVIRSSNSKGIHYTRNILLNKVKTKYAISIDDDANFLTNNVLKEVSNYFKENEKVGLISFRSFWSKERPNLTLTNETPIRVKSFGAVSFAIRVDAWKETPNFLEWFKFYGEEDFVAFQLFKKGREVHYLPSVLVHHRVDIKSRKKNKDYRLRLRRALRSGWYLYILFYPIKEIPRRFLYTFWMQLKLKVFKGDFKAFLAIVQALFDVLINFPRLIKNSNRLTKIEFKEYQKIEEAKIYWKPINHTH
ncbi:MAG: glycosyltransferase family 2 protein [Flavobacteriaceae bacterium]|nr:glycosyltransferase family 2 protein [Flavobacteriaceae bacterium]